MDAFMTIKLELFVYLSNAMNFIPIFFNMCMFFSSNYSQHLNALFVLRSMEEDELMSEFDGGDNEIEMGKDGQELENIEMEKPLEEGENLKEVVIEPHRGMIFGSIEEAHEYYT